MFSEFDLDLQNIPPIKSDNRDLSYGTVSDWADVQEDGGYSIFTAINDASKAGLHSSPERAYGDYIKAHYGVGTEDELDKVITPEIAKKEYGVEVKENISILQANILQEIKETDDKIYSKFGRHLSWKSPINALAAFATMGLTASLSPTGIAIGAGIGVLATPVGGAVATGITGIGKALRVFSKLGKVSKMMRRAKRMTQVTYGSIGREIMLATKATKIAKFYGKYKPTIQTSALAGTGNALEELIINYIDKENGIKRPLIPDMVFGFFAPAVFTALGMTVAKGFKKVNIKRFKPAIKKSKAETQIQNIMTSSNPKVRQEIIDNPENLRKYIDPSEESEEAIVRAIEGFKPNKFVTDVNKTKSERIKALESQIYNESLKADTFKSYLMQHTGLKAFKDTGYARLYEIFGEKEFDDYFFKVGARAERAGYRIDDPLELYPFLMSKNRTERLLHRFAKQNPDIDLKNPNTLKGRLEDILNSDMDLDSLIEGIINYKQVSEMDLVPDKIKRNTISDKEVAPSSPKKALESVMDDETYMGDFAIKSRTEIKKAKDFFNKCLLGDDK